MVSEDQLPYMFKLIDDPSESVQKGLLEAFSGMGQSIYKKIQHMQLPPSEAQLRDLFRSLEAISEKNIKVSRMSLFRPGELICHRRYGYRGVVVDVDLFCFADEAWYMRNRSQPPRLQPWYHILVDKSDAVTYAAESSLDLDDADSPVSHPYLSLFFQSYIDGIHVRNERPWPKEDIEE